jgi:hypothetical protein
MRTWASFVTLVIGIAGAVGAADPKAAVPDKVLFDFEDAAELKAFSNLEPPAIKHKEPAAKWELSTENATSGKHSLKITFAGGRFPTITTTQVLDDWTPYQTFLADVTVSRPCVVGFTALQEKSKRGTGWDDLISRWTKTAFLKAGRNTVVGSIPQPNDYSIHAKWGKVIRFEIFMYQPQEGESIYVDNIRLSAKKETAAPTKTQFKVLGTDLVVGNVQELGKKLADKWTKPEAQTVEKVEAAFRAKFEELKKTHPKAVLAIFRDGDKGYDPAQPDKVYAGWKDAYWTSHGPDSNTEERAANRGKVATEELFMRHRSPLMQMDLTSIPKGSNILAAQLLVVRASNPGGKDHGTDRPTMWVAEACNRPWEEYEVNAYEFAKDKFWKNVGGMYWGDDPDFLPVYLAHGPGRDGCNTWDFTQAVRFWTDGEHANHGFMLHGDSKDYFRGWYREAPEVKNRPALLVVYEPRTSKGSTPK